MALPMTPAKPFDPNSVLGDRSTYAARSGVGNAAGATPGVQQRLNGMAEAAYDKQKAANAGLAPASTPAPTAAVAAPPTSAQAGRAADAQTAKMQAYGAQLKARMDAAAAKRAPVAKPAGAAMGLGRAKGGPIKAYAKGGSVSSRADGCATKGKTKGKMV
jgi:hypothetical protein